MYIIKEKRLTEAEFAELEGNVETNMRNELEITEICKESKSELKNID